MVKTIILSILLVMVLVSYYQKNKERFEESNVIMDEDAEEEFEEEFEEEEEEAIQEIISETLSSVNETLESIDESTLGHLKIRQEYEDNTYTSPESIIDFKETTEKMKKRNTYIPIEMPHDLKSYPCRTNTHTWDHTGVHKIEDPSKNCNGINSSLDKRHPQLFFHPSNFFMTHGDH